MALTLVSVMWQCLIICTKKKQGRCQVFNIINIIENIIAIMQWTRLILKVAFFGLGGKCHTMVQREQQV